MDYSARKGIVAVAVCDDNGVIALASHASQQLESVIKFLASQITDLDSTYLHSYAPHEKTLNCAIQMSVEHGVAFISASDPDFPKRIGFRLLQSVSDHYSRIASSSHTDFLAFQKWMIDEMDFFSSNPDADRIRKLNAEVGQVIEITQEGITQLMSRGQDLEYIQGRTKDLEAGTEQWKITAEGLGCWATCKNIKWWIYLCAVCICVVFLVAASLSTGLFFLIKSLLH